jgi:hypothetical protein
LGWQSLGQRKVTRYAELLGVPVIAVICRGGSHWMRFVTADHRHGMVLAGKHIPPQWQWEEPARHWSSCFDRWPEQVSVDAAGHRLFPGEACPAGACQPVSTG